MLETIFRKLKGYAKDLDWWDEREQQRNPWKPTQQNQ